MARDAKSRFINKEAPHDVSPGYTATQIAKVSEERAQG